MAKQMIRRWAPMGLWTTGCLCALAALWSVDQRRFELPPADPGTWSQWSSERELLDVAAAGSRLLATVALTYLLVVSVAHLLALLWGPARLRRITALLNPGPLAAIAATAVLGGSPLAAAAGSPGTPGAPGGADDPPAPVMRMIEREGPEATTGAPSPERSAAPSTTAPTRPPVGTTDGHPDAHLDPANRDEANRDKANRDMANRDMANGETRSERPRDRDDRDYTVVKGDHLWGIAEARVRTLLGRQGTETEIRGYWLALIDLNAPRMPEPGNPDLLLPGQELRLPG